VLLWCLHGGTANKQQKSSVRLEIRPEFEPGFSWIWKKVLPEWTFLCSVSSLYSAAVLLLLSSVLLQCPLHWVSIYVQSAYLFVPITVILYSPFSLFEFLIHILTYIILSHNFLFQYLNTVSYVLTGYLLTDFQPLTAPNFSQYFCVVTQFNDKLTSVLPLSLQYVFYFPLLSHSHLFSNFLSHFYLYSTALYIILFSPAIFHFKVTQIRFHTLQKVAKRSCSPSTVEQSGAVHKEAVHASSQWPESGSQ
jgi:hypothetical protein